MNAQTRAPIDAFLDAVDLALLKSRTARNTRAGIVTDLESHILDALSERAAGREPTPADVSQVLATLGRPEAYAPANADVAAPSAVAPRRVLAPYLPTGGVLAIAGMIGLVILINFVGSRFHDPADLLLYLIAGTPVILMLVFASSLGVVAFRTIQRQPQRYWGRFFAAVEISAAPILVLLASPMLFFTVAFTLLLLYIANRLYNLRDAAGELLAHS